MTTLPENKIPGLKLNFKFLMQHPAHFFALGFGSGLTEKAPGTAGTLLGFPLFYCIIHLNTMTQCGIIVGLFLIGIYICGITGRHIGVSDHGSIVWDEIIAMMLVLTFTPKTMAAFLIAFMLFRLFDIWKPYPIRQCDAKLKGGFGVMFDDLLAAIYAIVCLQGLLWMMPTLAS